MIRLRRFETDLIEEIPLEEFERRAREGRISPRDQVCFPLLTGADFVPARDLEMFRGLRASDAFNFREYFTLGRIPWTTLTLSVILTVVWFGWQRPAPDSAVMLVEQGAKAPSLMGELGQWWRLISANLLHVSGWHLAVNVLFLFNIGGPAEAAYRRVDYLTILVASALGTNLLSTLANPSVSCGASGIVFGVWGALAVFGIRYRELLPERHRRYFIGNVIPYSVVTLYLGFAMPGVDNWGHLGGLVAGASVSTLLPARLLKPSDRFVLGKVATIAAVFVALALMSVRGPQHTELVPQRLYSRLGLSASVPIGWDERLTERDNRSEVIAFGNEAEVGLGVRIERLDRPVTEEALTKWFSADALEEELALADAQAIRITQQAPRNLDGVPAVRFSTDMLTGSHATRSEHFLFARGHYRYVLSFSAPKTYAPNYMPLFDRILETVSLAAPRELDMARREARQQPSPESALQLYRAYVHTGESAQADKVLRAARARWPESISLREATE
ncbi:MAG: rhomboid family intramembrane serine protease [Myxococcota bacterium]